MRQLFVLFLAAVLLAGCSGGSSSTNSNIGNGGGGNGGNGGNDGGGAGGGGSDGGDGGGGGEPPFISNFNVFDPAERATYENGTLLDIARVERDDELGGLSNTTSLPPSGTLEYEGYLYLFVGNQFGTARINGDASLQIQLLGRTITGSADNFAGYAPDENADEQLIAYEGAPVQFSNGVLSDPDGTASVIMDINGELSNGVNTFNIDGQLEGHLYGASGEGLHAYGSPRAGGLGDMDSGVDGQAATFQSATLSMLRVSD